VSDYRDLYYPVNIEYQNLEANCLLYCPIKNASLNQSVSHSSPHWLMFILKPCFFSKGFIALPHVWYPW
jgi:hypothetical protein